ncbi:GIY-YIG nuclease family protein [Desertivibrio insolitus]|uniref:GIY-YIG nuclease family protein n=1 Tax=Herbiconiux sp. SYSU D00978 TaxID=2812562 RepID=UPI001A973F20|nr:GIY-YIG nuclease family protein [Herbiconiux sp. SYSU D00978]
MTTPDASRCDIRDCGQPAQQDAPLPLCTRHLLEAYEWVARDVGVADVLPSPCLVCGSRLGVRYPSGWICGVCEWRLGEAPDAEVEVARVDVVYYLRYRDRIKIGTTVNPRQRFAALLFDEVLAFERGGRPLEQRRHSEFAAHRAPGTEWFEIHDELLAHVERLRAGVDDPWQLYARWVSEALDR